MTDQHKIEELCFLLGKVTTELRMTAFKIKTTYRDEVTGEKIESKVNEMEEAFKELIYKDKPVSKINH